MDYERRNQKNRDSSQNRGSASANRPAGFGPSAGRTGDFSARSGRSGYAGRSAAAPGWEENELHSSGRSRPRGTVRSKNQDAGAGRNLDEPSAKTPEREVYRKHNMRQKKRRMAVRRRRFFISIGLVITALLILMFLTPVFNIQTIQVDGNQIVSVEQINEQIGNVIGQNLFKNGKTSIAKKLSSIAYIQNVEVSKHLFPPSMTVTITECVPGGYFKIDGNYIVIDETGKALEQSSVLREGIPQILGIEDASYTVGQKIKVADEEKSQVLLTCLQQMHKTGLLERVKVLSVENLTSIKFTYDDRLEVLCGSQLDLERKLRLFREAVTSSNLAENAHGTMDLSVTGKAIYTP